MSYNQSLSEVIRASGAYNNRFFDRCKATRQIEAKKLLTYSTNWYYVTKCFALNGFRYLEYLAGELHLALDPTDKMHLRSALQQATSIIANDLGLGLDHCGNPAGPQGIHYVLFGHMVEELGIDFDELDRDVLWQSHRILEEETNVIRQFLHEKFADLTGAACLRVIEEIAFNIVDSMLPLYSGAVFPDGRLVYLDRKELLYITLHLQIEKSHAEQSDGIIGETALDRNSQTKIRETVTELSTLFAKFWEKMYEKTFA